MMRVGLTLVTIASLLLLLPICATDNFTTLAHDGPKVKWEQMDLNFRPSGRIPAASVACDGKLFVFGGETDVKSNDPMVVNRYLNDLWMFSPSLQESSWTQLSLDGQLGSPDARVSSSMVCRNSTLTIFGGITKAKSDFVKLSDLWSFSIAHEKWIKIEEDSATAGSPGPLSSHTATLTDSDQDSMVIFGGNDAEYSNVNKLWIYSLSKKQWVLKRPPYSPGARDFHTAVAIPNTATFKIWGGIDDGNVWVYDIKANTWLPAGPALSYRSGRMGTILDGRLFSFGGLEIKSGGEVDYTNEMSANTADDGSWEAVHTDSTVLPVGRCYATVVSIKGSIWMYGGYHRPASVERLPDLWHMTPKSSSLMV